VDLLFLILAPAATFLLLFVLLPWLVLRRLAAGRRARAAEAAEQQALAELMVLARRLDSRISTVERLLAAPETPNRTAGKQL
jgi:phage shock protein B